LRVRRTISAPLQENLPPLLAINAGVKSADHLDVWQDSRNGATRFLQDKFSVQADSDGSIAFSAASNAAGAVSYELRGMVCQIQAEGEASHLIALAKSAFAVKKQRKRLILVQCQRSMVLPLNNGSSSTTFWSVQSLKMKS
jgi:hypothetical protein